MARNVGGGGGHEDLNRALAKTNELIADIDRLAGAEAAYQGAVGETMKAEAGNTGVSRTRTRAKKEGLEVAEREKLVTERGTKAIKLDTEAIARNTEARQKANSVQAMGQRAVYGARSPQYAQAYALKESEGAIPSQYRLRQIPGVGQRRAAAMVEAMQAGLKPSSGGAHDVLNQVEEAHRQVALSEYRLAQANEEYTRIKRKGTQQETEAAYATKERLKAERQSALAHIATAEEETASRAAMRQSRRERKVYDDRLLKAIDAAEEQRATAYQQRVAAGRAFAESHGLPAPGQTAQGMPVGLAQTRTRAYMPDWAKGDRSIEAIRAAREAAEASRNLLFQQRQLPAPGQTAQGMPVVAPQVFTRAQNPAIAARDAAAAASAHRASAEAMAAEAEAQGRLTEAARIHNDVLNNPARAKALQLSALTAEYEKQNAAAYARSANAYTQAASAFYPLNQAMHRHGALTSEFIAAAARGETTLKELGNQAVITAGKFAGWTVAATGVYGLVGALQQVGEGAMAASSGADQAFRVITENKDRGALQGGFADLSREFNVPIETAADAVYRMGQVFHDQARAVEAARASLLSYKTGEVSVEESTKSLIAIQRGYGLSSGELVAIFDQINQAQNVFGVSIGNVESGLARAGGTWKNAGGDLSYLLAIMVAVQKATGESGNVIGTPFSRLYYVQHPENAEKLKKLGVDVDTRNAQSTFQSLMEQAQKPGADIQALASGFAGNQYARLFTGMLADQKTFNEALKETGAEASKGSGMRELSRILGQVDEQIAALGNGLQRIGEELGQAGAFTFFGLMLKAMNGTLAAAEAILSVFNLIPTPIRQALMLIGQMALAMNLLRRLGAAERFANTPLGFLADPAGRQKTHTVVGLREGVQQARNRVERFGQINVDRAFENDLAQRHLREEMQPRLDAVKHLDPESDERKEVEKEYRAASRKAIHAELALAQSTIMLDQAREVAAYAEKELTTAQKTSKRQFAATAAQHGWPAVNQLDQPNMQGVTQPGSGGGPIIVGTGGRRAPVPGAGAAAATAAVAQAEATRMARAASQIQTRVAETTAALRVAPGQMNAALASWGASGAVLARGATASGKAAQKAAGGLRGAGGALRGMMSGLGALAAALGPLDLILIGIAGIFFFKDQVKKLEKGADDARQALTRQTPSQSDVKKQLEKANSVLKENQEAKMPGDTFNATGQSGGWFGPIKGILNTGDVVQAWWNDWTGQTQAAQEVIANHSARMQAQERQRKAGKPLPQLTYDELAKSIEQDAVDRQHGIISQREFDERMANHAIEAKVMLDGNKENVKKAQQKIAEANRSAGGQGYGASLVPLSTEDFQKEIQGTLAAVELYGLTDHNIAYLKAQYQAAEQKFRNSKTPEALAALNQARQAYMQAVIGEVSKELQLDILQAGSEQERRAAYKKAGAAYDKMRITFKEQNSRMRADQKKEREELRRKQKLEDQGGFRHQAGIGEEPGVGPAGTYDPSDEEVQKREDRQRRERMKLNREQKKKLNKELQRQNRELTIAQLQLKQQAYDDRQQGREILLNLQVSQTRDPQEQARLRLDMARRQVQDAEREWGDKSRQYRQALTELNNARYAQADAILATVQADNALILARASDDPVTQARTTAENTQRELDAMLKAGPGMFSPDAIKTKRAELITNRRQARDAASDQMQQLARLRGELAAAQAGGDPVLEARAALEAAQLAQQVANTPVEKLQALVDLAKANNQLRQALADREKARFDLLKSQTDDPVEQARLDMEAAKAALAGTKGYERMQRLTDYNNAKRAWKQSKIDDTQDTINFQLQMDQITNEEAARQLEALANVKGISKAKKRELLLQAKQLRDEASGDYELDVGSIRLPSLYEVRRFVGGGQPTAAQQQVVTDNRVFTVNLQTAEAVNAFAQQLEITNGTSAKSAARSMMMR